MDSYMKVGGDGVQAATVNMGAMMGHMLMVLHKHNVSLRGDVAMTIMTMSIAEGLVRQLDPDFDVVRRAIPYFVQFRCWNSASLRCCLPGPPGPCSHICRPVQPQSSA